MPEEVRILWILAYYNGTYYSLKPFYALSENDAENQVQAWIEQQLPSKIVRESLRAFPGGFKIGTGELPGKISNTKQAQAEERPGEHVEVQGSSDGASP